MKVIINNNIYDITTFIPEHPGGSGVFTKYITSDDSHDPDNKTIPDLTQRFNKVGHSEYAVNLLGNYKIDELSEDDPRFNRNNNLEYNKTKISKLITHEDKFHIHKSMGLISIVNYFYLLFDFIYSGADANMSLRSVNGGFIALTWIHSILSLSSLQFLIPRTRTGILPMIWQEFRAHSIVFAVRSFLIINLMYYLFYDASNHATILSPRAISVRLAIVLLAMKLADISTGYLRENHKETTTATMPYWSYCPARLQTVIKYFYTHSQFMATIVCLFGTIPYILAIAFPIQIASFLMTLVRKNIISAFWYHMLYGNSLLIVYLVNIRDKYLYLVIVLGITLIYLRVNLKVNKYVLWSLTAVVGIFVKYASSPSVSGADSMYAFGLFAIPVFSFYCYHFVALTWVPCTEFGHQILDAIFDNYHIREESNNRVKSNDIIETIYNKITIQFCSTYAKYKPGMYFNLYFDTNKRPYTAVEYMTAASGKADVATFLIRRMPNGAVSPLICDKYLVNQTVFVKGPFGRNYYDPSPDVRGFVCDGAQIRAKYIIMCSCGTGITPMYSMGNAWVQDRKYSECRQQLHYLSSYRSRNQAVLRVSTTDNADALSVRERLFISDENTKLTPGVLIDYLTDIINDPDQTNTTEDIAVFICGTSTYSEMVKDTCHIISYGMKCYVW